MTPTTPQLSIEQRKEILDLWNGHPGMKHMGARVDLTESGEVRATLDPIREHHRGGLGTSAVNGAVMSGLFDLVTGLTGYLYVRGRRAGVAELSIHFLRPVEGDSFEVCGRPKRVGRHLVFTESELVDDTGRVCATCDGIVAVAGSALPEDPDHAPL